MNIKFIPHLFKTWIKVFLNPRTDIFRGELVRKSNLTTFIGIAIAAVIGLGLSWLTHLIAGQPPEEFMGLASAWVEKGTQPPFGSWSIIVFLGVIAGFYDFEIILFIFAWLLRGKGSFGTQAYVQSLFYAPLAVVQQIFAVIPGIGFILFIIVAAWSLVPTTTSLKAAHGYSTLKAILTWLLPVVLNIVVVYVVVQILSAKAA